MAGPSTHDAGYLAFVQLLQEKNDLLSILSLPKIAGATVHYLSTLPLEYVPTFANTVATSPSLWSNASSREEVCMSLQAAFRVAAAGRLQDTETSGGRSRKKTLNSWTNKVLEGVTAQHPEPDIGLALLTGLLQGIQDLRDIKSGTAKLRLEIEVSALCAELLDSLPSDREVPGDWTVEYRSAIAQPSSDRRSYVLRTLAPPLLALPVEKLLLLDLERVIRLAIDSATTVLEDGRYLRDIPGLLNKTPNGTVTISSESVFAQTIQRITGNPTFTSFSAISKVIARCNTALSTQKSTEDVAWKIMSSIASAFEKVSTTVEADWAKSPLCNVVDEKDIAEDTKPILTSLWQIQKTFLFFTILICQSFLRILTYDPLPEPLATAPETHPQALVGFMLNTFFHLAFITSKFGGGLTSQGGGFPEQKRCFYAALDILAHDKWETELYLRKLYGRLAGLNLAVGHPVREARTSFFFACSEQLMSVISENMVVHYVLPVTGHYLSRPENRETYESAHSVVLSVFSSHSGQHKDAPTAYSHDAKVGIAQRIAPFYMDCLIKNSGEGKLSDDQLCLAYASLVSGAGSIDNALAQMCIDTLLSNLSSLKDEDYGLPNSKQYRLRLMLVSLISTVNGALLPSLLEQSRRAILEETNFEGKVKLREAAFKQVLERIADTEREVAMRWWLRVRPELLTSELDAQGTGSRDAIEYAIPEVEDKPEP